MLGPSEYRILRTGRGFLVRGQPELGLCAREGAFWCADSPNWVFAHETGRFGARTGVGAGVFWWGAGRRGEKNGQILYICRLLLD